MDALNQSISHISAVGSSPLIFVAAGIVFLFLASRKEWLRFGFVALSLCSGLYSAAIKSFFRLSRPNAYVPEGFIPWERVLKSEVYAFPSTHTVLYTAFFGYLVYLSYALKGVDKVVRHFVRTSCAVMIILVGGSRVLLGAHYVRDVVAGYLFGLIYLGLLIAGERFLAEILLSKSLKRKKR